MRVLFDINHPAQVHLFKHAIWELQQRGHETLVTSRKKEMTTELLDAYDIEHRPLTEARDGAVGVAAELGVREFKLLWRARRFDPDVVVSRLVPAAVHTATALGARNVVLKDTILPSRLMRGVYHGLTLPFVDEICTPPGFDLPVDSDRHHVFGFQELAYLHPERFEPDPSNLKRHDISPDEPFYVLRFAGWNAYHDVGKVGLSREAKRDLVSFLSDRGDVYITSEEPLPPAFEDYRITVPPEHVHDLLYFADLYVGDSQTMPTESALLGTPAIQVNSLVGEHDMHNFVALEEEYGLLSSYADGAAAVEKAKAIVANLGVDDRWEQRRQRLVDQERDVTGYLLDLILTDDPAARWRRREQLTDPTEDESDREERQYAT